MKVLQFLKQLQINPFWDGIQLGQESWLRMAHKIIFTDLTDDHMLQCRGKSQAQAGGEEVV